MVQDQEIVVKAAAVTVPVVLAAPTLVTRVKMAVETMVQTEKVEKDAAPLPEAANTVATIQATAIVPELLVKVKTLW